MYAQTVEESFHYDRAGRVCSCFRHGAMEIKNDLRLAEAWREQVPGLGIIHAAAGVGDQSALAIVNRKHDPMPQESSPGIVADPKPRRGGEVHSALLQVGMPVQAQREGQGREELPTAALSSF